MPDSRQRALHRHLLPGGSYGWAGAGSRSGQPLCRPRRPLPTGRRAASLFWAGRAVLEEEWQRCQLTGDLQAAEDALATAVSLHEDTRDDAGRPRRTTNLAWSSGSPPTTRVPSKPPAPPCARPQRQAVNTRRSRRAGASRLCAADDRRLGWRRKDLHRADPVQGTRQPARRSQCACISESPSAKPRNTRSRPPALSKALAIYRKLGSRLGEASWTRSHIVPRYSKGSSSLCSGLCCCTSWLAAIVPVALDH
jgi:hypothetical protein